MNARLKVLLSVAAMGFLLTACGGSSDSNVSDAPQNQQPPLDNSIIADSSNIYGFYGNNIIYGNTIAAGDWTLYMSIGGTKLTNAITMEADSTLIWTTSFDTVVFTYGISSNGKILTYGPEGGKLEIEKVFDNDCYGIKLLSSNDSVDDSMTLCKNNQDNDISTPEPTPPPTPEPTPPSVPEPTPPPAYTPPSNDYSCGSKKYCTQMNSCSEAMYYYKTCGLTRLDGDKDGIPCESLCK